MTIILICIYSYSMYVCICNGVTDSHIRKAVDEGVQSFRELSMATGCSRTCGRCSDMAQDIFNDAVSKRLPVIATNGLTAAVA